MTTKMRKAIFPTTLLCIGLFYAIHPILSGIFEVLDPYIARTIFLPFDWLLFAFAFPMLFLFEEVSQYYYDIVFVLIFLGYIVYFMKVVRPKWDGTPKKLAIFSLILIPVIILVLSPLGITFQERRINSFQIGGWLYLQFTGNINDITKEAQDLVEYHSGKEYLYRQKSELPPTISQLGGWVKVDNENQIVYVGKGSMTGMSAEFGFMILVKDTQSPSSSYLEKNNILRVWKLAEGIYLFMQ